MVSPTIVFWTSAKPSVIKRTVGQTLQHMPQTPPHRFVSVLGDCYQPGPDELVLAMGADAINLMAQEGLVPKNRTADSLRGKIFKKGTDTGSFMVGIDPAIIEVDPGRESDIAWDVQLIARLARTGGLLPVLGSYRWVEDFSDLIASIEQKFEATGKPVAVSGDIETVKTSPFIRGAKIVAIGFTDTEGKADLLYLRDLKTNEQARLVHSQIKWLLNSPKVRTRGANFKFDLNFILVLWGIDCTNFSMDTVLAGSVLNENRSNSLKNHVKTYVTELGGYDDVLQKGEIEHMDLLPKERMLDYLGGDVDGTLRVSNVMVRDLQPQRGLSHFYVHVLHPASTAFQRIERVGIPVDLKRFEVLRKDLETESARLHAEGLALLPARLRAKFSDDLSLTRPALLKEYFFGPMGLNLKPLVLTGKTKEPSTAKSHLEMFADVPETKAMCAVLDSMNQANKALSTYVVGFLSHLRSDGRFHPTYFLHKGDNDWGTDDGGTNTGRLSAKDPAVQTVPKKTKWGKRIRECLVTLAGYVIVEADFSQGELKIAACLADETNMIASYKAGIDLHMKTGAGLAGLTLEQMIELKTSDPAKFALYRGKAKPANFGIIYGISATGYQAYAWNGYRLRIPLDEAENTIAMFFETYPALPEWHKAYKRMAHKNGYVVSPLGRVRHLPDIYSPISAIRAKAERRAVNAPDQATLSDMMCMAIAQLNREHPEYIPFAMIHDAGYWFVPEDKVEQGVKDITGVMGNLPLRKLFGWDHQLDFNADATVGLDLGHMEELKPAA